MIRREVEFLDESGRDSVQSIMKRKELARVCVMGAIIGLLLVLPHLWVVSGIKRIALWGGAFGVYFALCVPSLKKRFNASNDSVFRLIRVLFGTFMIGKSVRDFSDFAAMNAYVVPAFDVAIFFLLIVIAWTSPRRVFDGKALMVVSAWAVGIALFAGINYAGSVAGIAQESGTASSLMNETRARMQIPFGPGLNLFGVVVAGGGIFAMEAMVSSIKQKSLFLLILNACALLMNSIAVVLVETRSVILPVLTYVFWKTCKSRSLRAWVTMMCVSVLLLTPLLGGMTSFFSFVADLIPGVIQNSISRSAHDLKEFGGRTVIWEYAFQELKAGNFKWFGDGQIERDTRPIFHLLFNYMPDTNTTFHNGFIDLVFVYGPFVGALGSITLILSVVWSGVLKPNRSRQRRANQTAISGLLIAISLCTILESSMTLNYFWVLFSVLIAVQNDCEDLVVEPSENARAGANVSAPRDREVLPMARHALG